MAHTHRSEVLARLADEVRRALADRPGLRLVLGHGSGSFGHVVAKQYGTRQGVQTPEQWRGFAVVWREAVALNRLVMDALVEADLPVLAFAPVSAVTSSGGRVQQWNLAPIYAALEHDLLPVVYGDVIFDRERGGTILSTEDLFDHLARQLKPQRILLAGIEPGVWADYPACTRLVEQIRPETLAAAESGLRGSAAPDVTGGMASKVRQSLDVALAVPGLQVQIFSGEEPELVYRALLGENPGTCVSA